MEELPVDAVRAPFLAHLARAPVVLSSPTGSGKSTQVPRWCASSAQGGRVLVIEPRRVACRSLAQRVAELEEARLGHAVGYHVRDERRARDDTRILFATPGIVLAGLDDLVSAFDVIVLDELHERRLDVDLLLALLMRRASARLVAMSATFDTARVASHLGGKVLEAEGRQHPVEVRHLPQGTLLPDVRGLEHRVAETLVHALGEEAPERRADNPHVLVFLPGKGEIAQVADTLRGRPDLEDVDVMPLHAGLTLEEQGRAFQPSTRRKVILATNVAETSVTVPGVGVVIDSGLVRRTRYHQGRGYLMLVPIAQDSADQRTGRAGRTGPGVCYRLWDAAAKLEPRTPPEVHRESLVPLVLGAAACGERAETLPFLDPPKDHALETAREELHALGALDAEGNLTARGRDVFGLPLDAHLGRLLVEAKARGTLDDAIDLVAALGVGRPLFVAASGAPRDDDEDLRSEQGCDAVALIRAVRVGEPGQDGLSRHALAEARSDARRLRRALGVGDPGDPNRPVDREALARTAMAADPRCIHVARRRKKEIGWSNGGTEIAVDPASAIGRREEQVDAVAVLGSRAVGDRRGTTRVVATCAMPVPLAWVREAGLGRDRVAHVSLEGERVVAHVQRVYAKRVIGEREEEPEGELAREAMRDLFLRGTLFRETLARTRERLQTRALAAQLANSTLDVGIDLRAYAEPPPPLEEWVGRRLEELGVEHGQDVALLSASDLLASDLPFEVRHELDREFPRTLDLGDARYEIDYDFGRRQVVLRMVRGERRKPPPLSFLPRFSGFRVCIEAGGSMHVVRE